MEGEMGLRERKKQRTRRLIADTAWRLFLERGFDRVGVAEVARQAELSEATVFNYFPTKEDLVFDGLARFEEQTLDEVRRRPAGESVLAAFGRLIGEPRGLLGSGEAEASERIAAASRIVAGSRSLLARERELYDRYIAELATIVAAERRLDPASVEARVVANALIGVQRALVDDVRSQVLAGTERREIARRVRARARRAMALLERGLGSGSDSGLKPRAARSTGTPSPRTDTGSTPRRSP
jgi:AcrR family transcriptional regulator